MKYKKSKSRLNEIASVIQGFNFSFKFGLLLIYILKIYRKKYSSILLIKNMFNSSLAFCFWKACNFFKFWKICLLELEQLLPALFSQNLLQRSIYLELLIIGGSIFALYLKWGAFSLVCVLSVFSSFLSFLFFSFSVGIFLDRR